MRKDPSALYLTSSHGWRPWFRVRMGEVLYLLCLFYCLGCCLFWLQVPLVENKLISRLPFSSTELLTATLAYNIQAASHQRINGVLSHLVLKTFSYLILNSTTSNQLQWPSWARRLGCKFRASIKSNPIVDGKYIDRGTYWLLKKKWKEMISSSQICYVHSRKRKRKGNTCIKSTTQVFRHNLY